MSTDAALPADAPPLPDDPVVLKQMIRELLATLRERTHENEGLRHRLDQLLRRLYGPRAERVNPEQLALFAELLQSDVAPPAPAPKPEDAPPRRTTPHGRRKPPQHLPRRRRVYELDEAERRCPCCGVSRTPIGEETSEQLDYEPASLFVVEHVRIKYGCMKCQEFATAPKPPQPIDKGLPGPGLLAQVAISKYDDHLPLHRQERIFERQGFMLNRSTTCQWMAGCAALLQPLFALMKARVLASKVIHADDTPVPVLDESRTTTRRGHLWAYLGDKDHPYHVFDFMPNHSRDGPLNFLAGFRGYLEADAYSGYEALYTPARGVIEVACWAHTRRYFFEAKESDAPRSHQALAFIRQLYAIEEQARDVDAAARATLRQQQARPILDAFHAWFDAQTGASDNPVLPKSPMGQAIAYARNNWDALVRYTDDGDLAIDNNAAERALRAVVTGRKNWLFAGSDAGGRTAAVLYSFTSTCRRHKLDSFAYLRDLFTRLPTHPPERLAELLPDRWSPPPRTSP